MSEHVSRAEFNELKGQLDLVCQHLGLDFGGLVTEGTGRRRAEPVVSDDFNGFEEDESFNFGSYNAPAQQEEESEEDEDEGWESINDDDLEHGFSPDEEEEEPTSEEESDEDDSVEAEPFVEEEEVSVEEPVKAAPATGGLPTSLHFATPAAKDEDAFDYADSNEEEDEVVKEDEEAEESHPYDETPDYQVEEASESTPDVLTRIFDDANALTAHDIAAKQFTTIKKTLFTSPYDEDQVDEVLDEYLEILQDRNVSESKYAAALLKIREVKFPESADGYKKAEVDGFLDQIANELQRRINVFS